MMELVPLINLSGDWDPRAFTAMLKERGITAVTTPCVRQYTVMVNKRHRGKARKFLEEKTYMPGQMDF